MTAKGMHIGSGGRVVKMIVAISYGKGVIYCEQYEKLDGNYYADFVHRNFQNMFQKSGKCSKLFTPLSPFQCCPCKFLRHIA